MKIDGVKFNVRIDISDKWVRLGPAGSCSKLAGCPCPAMVRAEVES
ncbi:hypothetical protein [Streptomyces sp. Caat 7-52]|nr:hypothetical protein [Streptomyces sp. Caat 7-52]